MQEFSRGFLYIINQSTEKIGPPICQVIRKTHEGKVLSIYRACRHLFLVVSHFLFGRICVLHTSKELHPNHDNETFSTRNRHVIIKYHESIWLFYHGFGNAVKFQYQLVSRRPSCLIMSGHMTSDVSSHSVLLLYVFDDSCNFPVLFQVQNIMSNHHLLTTVQWLDSRGLFLVIISPRKGSLSLFSGDIVKLSEGWISFSVDKKTEADETSGILLRFFGDTANRKQTSCFGFPIFLQYGT